MKQDNCKQQEACAHYFGQDKLHVYRHKFIWSIVISTVIVIVLFVLLLRTYDNSLNEIVNLHREYHSQIENLLKPLTISKDSCVYVNEQLANCIEEGLLNTQSVLQLQSTRIQSDFTLLSLWAGILMIVFLIFSIYSIFKTDELMKQGREGLKVIEDSKSKVDSHILEIENKAEEEIKKVSNAADVEITRFAAESSASLDELRKQIEDKQKAFGETVNKIREEFDESVNKKTDDFQTVYNNYVKKLSEASENADGLLQQFIKAVQNRQREEQDSDNVTKKGDE